MLLQGLLQQILSIEIHYHQSCSGVDQAWHAGMSKAVGDLGEGHCTCHRQGRAHVEAQKLELLKAQCI